MNPITQNLVRRNDRATSIEASRAHRMADPTNLTPTQLKVLTSLHQVWPEGLADHEHYDRTGIQQSTAGKRRGELEQAGLVEDSGERRTVTYLGAQTRPVMVWRITLAGVEALEASRRGAGNATSRMA